MIIHESVKSFLATPEKFSIKVVGDNTLVATEEKCHQKQGTGRTRSGNALLPQKCS